jgi:hypothetical protein
MMVYVYIISEYIYIQQTNLLSEIYKPIEINPVTEFKWFWRCTTLRISEFVEFFRRPEL